MLHRFIRYSCIYEVRMSPTLNRFLAIQCFKHSNAIEIRDQITFNFCMRLPHVFYYFRESKLGPATTITQYLHMCVICFRSYMYIELELHHTCLQILGIEFCICNGASVLEADLFTSIDMLITSVLSFLCGISPLCLISIFIDDVAMTLTYCSRDISWSMYIPICLLLKQLRNKSILPP